MLNRVAIFSQNSDNKTAECVSYLVNDMCHRGIHVLLSEKTSSDDTCSGDKVERFSSFSDLTEMPDIVISVGGDGTFLETMLYVRGYGIPVAGINTGRLGFLANIPWEELTEALNHLYNEEYDVVSRSLLEITSPDNLFNSHGSYALNEITIQKADLNMITINVFVDNTYLNTYWADGLIISTATGSTAYNLSSGGPILSPGDESIIISPISPHNLTIRPIVLSGSSSLKMVIEGRGREYLATCDFRWKRLSFSNDIIVRQPKERFKTVMLHGTDFYGTLRSKLMWGADKRN